ncbi:MAG TPA: hypothetical protein DEP42_02405 [Ruminococcaceae bacterium]|nr:hypothetical protein [Oscillospiraceae bacterium]
MSKIRFQAKLQGRRMLTGKWRHAILITFLFVLLVLGVSLLEKALRTSLHIPQLDSHMLLNMDPRSALISGVFCVVTFLVITPLTTGQTEWYWHLAQNKERPIGDVLGWFGSLRLYGKSILLGLQIIWRMALWGLAVYAAPIVLMLIDEFILGYESLPSAILYLVAMVLILVGSVFLTFIAMRYFLAVYLLVEKASRKTTDCVKASVRYSRSFRWEIFKFQWSFIFWWLLCYLFIPIFYVYPYYSISSVELARHVLATKRTKRIEGEDGVIAQVTLKEDQENSSNTQ